MSLGERVWGEKFMYTGIVEEVVGGRWHAILVILGFEAFTNYVGHVWLSHVQGMFLPTVSPAGPALGPLYIKILV